MIRLATRDHSLRELDTPVLLEFLNVARKRGYAASILEIELELSSRRVWKGATEEPQFPLAYISDPERRNDVALSRLRTAASVQDFETFMNNLSNLDPANFAEAWRLTRAFEDTNRHALLLIRCAFWIATYFKGSDEAEEILKQTIEGKSAKEVIAVLERDFILTFDVGSEVRDA